MKVTCLKYLVLAHTIVLHTSCLKAKHMTCLKSVTAGRLATKHVAFTVQMEVVRPLLRQGSLIPEGYLILALHELHFILLWAASYAGRMVSFHLSRRMYVCTDRELRMERFYLTCTDILHVTPLYYWCFQ